MVSIGRGPCEYAFGIFGVGACETYYNECEYGEPIAQPCTPGLVYDERIHGCNWPDLLETCVPEGSFFNIFLGSVPSFFPIQM